MPKKINIEIKESLEYLEKEYCKAKGILKKDRIKTLIYVKLNKFDYQSDIGKKLGRAEKTIRGWLQAYEKLGFTSLIEVKSGGNNTKTISQKAIDFIEKNIRNEKTTITSYVELKLLLEQTLNEKIAYGALYSHCRRKHKSKLKVARKSHYKKNQEAVELFKKP
jgi:transposase